MTSKEILTKSVRPLKPEDSGKQALSEMEKSKLGFLPVVDKGIYRFLVSEEDVLKMKDRETKIEGLSSFSPYVMGTSSIVEDLHLMVKYKVSLLPVLNEGGKYQGAVTSEIVMEKLSLMIRAADPGAVVGLEMDPKDYDLSELVRIVESNDVKILSFFSYLSENTKKLNVLLKLDAEDASPVLRSFERFNYNILFCSQRPGMIDDIMKKRLDELLYYLEM